MFLARGHVAHHDARQALVRDLAHRVESIRHEGASESVLRPVEALVGEVNALNATIKDAMVFGAPPPPIEGLSSTGGFEGFKDRASLDGHG